MTDDHPVTSTPTDAELRAAFDEHQRSRGLSPATLKRRDSCFAVLTREAPRPLTSLTSRDLEHFLAGCVAQGTRVAYFNDLRAAYSWWARIGMIDRDPTVEMVKPRRPKSLPHPLAADELAAVTGAARGPIATMVTLGHLAGLRVSEIAVLRWRDVHLDTSPPVLVVRDGKGRRDRTIALHPRLVITLAGLPRGSTHVVERPRGGPYKTISVTMALTKHFKACGVAGGGHRLRHTFGTNLARVSNGNVVLVANLMGHSNLETTMGYINLAGGGHADVIARIA